MIAQPIPDAHVELLRALGGRCGALRVVGAASERWASATFNGARHQVTARFEGPEAGALAGRFCSGIGAAEFDLPGHIVADIEVRAMVSGADGVRVEIEALTVEGS